MTGYLACACPVCGGRLRVDVQYPDRVYCDTCDYPDMKVYEGFGPGGRMETTPVSARKAESNLRYRLRSECGLSVYNAARYGLRPIREVKR